MNHLTTQDLRVIADILDVYEDKMKRNKMTIPSMIVSAILHFRLEFEGVNKIDLEI